MMSDKREVAPESGTYRSVLKSTSILGFASIANIFIELFRTKFAAVLLGSSGVGLIGVYASITGMVSTLTGKVTK